MIRRHKKDIFDYLADAICAVSLLILAWIFVSYIDVIWDNAAPNPHHYSWNFFVVLVKYFAPY